MGKGRLGQPGVFKDASTKAVQDHIGCSVEEEAKLIGFGTLAAKPVCTKVELVFFDVEFCHSSTAVNLLIKPLGLGFLKARHDVANVDTERSDGNSCYDPPGYAP